MSKVTVKKTFIEEGDIEVERICEIDVAPNGRAYLSNCEVVIKNTDNAKISYPPNCTATTKAAITVLVVGVIVLGIAAYVVNLFAQ